MACFCKGIRYTDYMKAIYLLSVMLLIGCGKKSIEPDFQPFVKAFMTDGAITNLAPINIQFGDLTASHDESSATCDDGVGTPTITVDKTWWKIYDDTQRTLLIYHELGHCILGRSHNSTRGADGEAVSIMYPSAIAVAKGFAENKAPYIQELFRP